MVTTARAWVGEPGHDTHSFRLAVNALIRRFGDQQWLALTLLQQLALLADFLPMTNDRTYASADDAAGIYVRNIGRGNIASYADTQLVNLRDAASLIVTTNLHGVQKEQR